MNWLPERAAFRRQLWRWTVRGGLCAAPSLHWALLAGFVRPGAIAAMVAGVATYVLVYAWVTAAPAYETEFARGNKGWALCVAANTRAVLAPVALVFPDIGLGLLALGFFGLDVVGRPEVARGASIGVVYLTTLLQGAFVSTTMLLLSLPLWVARELWTRRK